MNYEKIFNDPEVTKVENDIVNLWEHGKCWAPDGTKLMQELLRQRWSLLYEFNQYDDQLAELLVAFNERLKSALTTLYHRTHKVFDEYMARDDYWGEVEVTGKCMLGYDYPDGHPVQTDRARAVWEVLTQGGFEGLYNSGVTHELLLRKDLLNCKFADSLMYTLYLSEELDNWNIEALDREWSSDMHLVFPFHNLYTHMPFSLYDLIWVRQFNLEINVNLDGDLNL